MTPHPFPEAFPRNRWSVIRDLDAADVSGRCEFNTLHLRYCAPVDRYAVVPGHAAAEASQRAERFFACFLGLAVLRLCQRFGRFVDDEPSRLVTGLGQHAEHRASVFAVLAVRG